MSEHDEASPDPEPEQTELAAGNGTRNEAGAPAGTGAEQARSRSSLFAALAIMIGFLWAGSATAYNYGAEAIALRTGGAAAALERDPQEVMFEVDMKTAFFVDSSGNISIVEYERGTFPFWPICGTFERTVQHVPAVHYMKGDWVYTGYPQFIGPHAYNLETGEVVSVKARMPLLGTGVDPSEIPAFVERGLDYDAKAELDVDRILESGFRQMRTINGSCITLNAAFMVMLALLGVVWGSAATVAAVRRLVARRRRRCEE